MKTILMKPSRISTLSNLVVINSGWTIPQDTVNFIVLNTGYANELVGLVTKNDKLNF